MMTEANRSAKVPFSQRLEAIASRMEATTIGVEAVAMILGWRPSLLEAQTKKRKGKSSESVNKSLLQVVPGQAGGGSFL